MTRDQALALARFYAAAKPQSYYSEPFQPHEWVLDVIQAAWDEGVESSSVHDSIDAQRYREASAMIRDRTTIVINADSQMLHMLRAILDICHDKQFTDAQRVALIVQCAHMATSMVDKGDVQIDNPSGEMHIRP